MQILNEKQEGTGLETEYCKVKNTKSVTRFGKEITAVVCPSKTIDTTKMPGWARDLYLQSIQCMYQPTTRLFRHVLE
jgi:hypothetical protein